jgi:hypothetical protein
VQVRVDIEGCLSLYRLVAAFAHDDGQSGSSLCCIDPKATMMLSATHQLRRTISPDTKFP